MKSADWQNVYVPANDGAGFYFDLNKKREVGEKSEVPTRLSGVPGGDPAQTTRSFHW